MKKNFLGLAAVALAVGLTLSACGGKKTGNADNKGDDLKGEISLSGAFALYPLAVQWADEFKQLHPGVKIDISAGGAGKGLTDALAEVVDFGMVSRELGDEEIKKGAVGFAVAKDAVVPTINAKNPALKDLLQKGLKLETLQRLWLKNDVKTWGEAVGSSNTAPVAVYTRSDACGAAETWAEFLGKKQEDLKGVAVFGDPGVASAVQKDVNGIGLNNIGYAYDGKTLKPNPGIVVAPIDVNNNGKVDPEENFYADKKQLVKAIKEGRYPSPPARDLYLVSKGVPKSAAALAFLEYVLTKGQKATEPQGYIGISQDKLDASLAKIKKAK